MVDDGSGKTSGSACAKKNLGVKPLTTDQLKLHAKYWAKILVKFQTKLVTIYPAKFREKLREKLPSCQAFSLDFPVSATDLGRKVKGETADFLFATGGGSCAILSFWKVILVTGTFFRNFQIEKLQ